MNTNPSHIEGLIPTVDDGNGVDDVIPFQLSGSAIVPQPYQFSVTQPLNDEKEMQDIEPELPKKRKRIKVKRRKRKALGWRERRPEPKRLRMMKENPLQNLSPFIEREYPPIDMTTCRLWLLCFDFLKKIKILVNEFHFDCL